MSVIIQPLWPWGTVLSGVSDTYFTAASPTRLDKITVSNPTLVTYFFTFLIGQNGQPLTPANEVVRERPIQPFETWDVWPAIGHALARGDYIAALANVAGQLNFYGSGTVISG